MGGSEVGLKPPLGAAVESDTVWRHLLWPSRTVESFVVSFPKSGRTWLRVMMAVVEAHARGDEADVVVSEWLDNDAPRLEGRRVLFTHALSANAHERVEAMSHFLGYIGDRPRLFLVRDPRDIVVSYFFHVAKRQRGSFRDGDLAGFVRDPRYGIDRILEFMCACERSLRVDTGRALLVAYERLATDPRSALLSVLEFFAGTSPSREGLEQALAFGRFDNMRRLELEGVFEGASARLATADPGDPESLKTRRGVVGGFREYLVDGDLAYVESRIAALMPPALGYLEPGVAPELRVQESAS